MGWLRRRQMQMGLEGDMERWKFPMGVHRNWKLFVGKGEGPERIQFTPNYKLFFKIKKKKYIFGSFSTQVGNCG